MVPVLPGDMAMRARPLEDRFWEKVNITLTCWEWTGARNTERGQRGYGSIRLGGKVCRAHRVSYELTYGPIPDGMQIDHRCNNKICVRPDHLRTVTNKQNSEHKSVQRNNKLGVRGVSLRAGRYVARVRHHQTYVDSSFGTLAEAEAWAIAKRAELFTHDDGVQAW